MRSTRLCLLLVALLLLQLGPRPVQAESLGPVRALIQDNRQRLQVAVRKAGGLLEVYHNNRVRLFVDGSGQLRYRRAGDRGARPGRVRWWGHFQRRNLPDLSVEALRGRLGALLAPSDKRDRTTAPTEPRAILPDGREARPDHYGGGFHGTTQVQPTVALKQGLPQRGADWRLKEHSEQKGCSAYRGCTLVASEPITGNGAAYWAGKGGWVYEIRGVPSWNVNRQLEGRVKTIQGMYRGNLMHGENEIAIPARVPSERIKAYGQVEEDSSGRLFVKTWIQNPDYRPASP